ncbi:MAG: HAD family hydrolase [Desulforhabdus sp.]|jgi:HAD superfamily hydrolase (TIGR01549 family)|nr:HAD family hydrolase [Desulforhabdus sp.]
MQIPAGNDKRFSLETLKVIAFDCDGVLFDSKEANIRFYNYVLEQFGHDPVRPEQHEYIHMHTVRESLQYLLGPGSVYEEAVRFCQTIDFNKFNAYMECEPGLKELLEFAKRSYHVALATNRTISTKDILTHFRLDKYFDLVVSACDVSFPKPHPESMEKIIRTFSASPQQILYVGDSSVDEALAMATGVFFVAYKNPNLEAHLYISHFRELHAFLSPPTPAAAPVPGKELKRND